MRDQRGFSLLEILAALVILTIVITVSFTAFYERTRRLQQAAEVVLAYQVLSNEAEYWRRIDLNELKGLKGEKKFRSSTELLEPLAPYKTVVTVRQTKPGMPGMQNVTMKIRWRDGAREAQLTLLRTDTGATNLW